MKGSFFYHSLVLFSCDERVLDLEVSIYHPFSEKFSLIGGRGGGGGWVSPNVGENGF